MPINRSTARRCHKCNRMRWRWQMHQQGYFKVCRDTADCDNHKYKNYVIGGQTEQKSEIEQEFTSD
jgi:hypothetical protein